MPMAQKCTYEQRIKICKLRWDAVFQVQSGTLSIAILAQTGGVRSSFRRFSLDKIAWFFSILLYFSEKSDSQHTRSNKTANGVTPIMQLIQLQFCKSNSTRSAHSSYVTKEWIKRVPLCCWLQSSDLLDGVKGRLEQNVPWCQTSSFVSQQLKNYKNVV